MEELKNRAQSMVETYESLKIIKMVYSLLVAKFGSRS